MTFQFYVRQMKSIGFIFFADSFFEAYTDVANIFFLVLFYWYNTDGKSRWHYKKIKTGCLSTACFKKIF